MSPTDCTCLRRDKRCYVKAFVGEKFSRRGFQTPKSYTEENEESYFKLTQLFPLSILRWITIKYNIVKHTVQLCRSDIYVPLRSFLHACFCFVYALFSRKSSLPKLHSIANYGDSEDGRKKFPRKGDATTPAEI